MTTTTLASLLEDGIAADAKRPAAAFTSDPARAVQFATKRLAEIFAAEIGWKRKDATPITVMGFDFWTVADDHCRMLTPSEAARLLRERSA